MAQKHPDDREILQNQLQEANQRGDEFLTELINLRGLRNTLVARIAHLEATLASMALEIELARDILPVISPPKWIDEFDLLSGRKRGSLQECHDWASRASVVWSKIDELSSDSKRQLEEASWATLRDSRMSTTASYSVTPLVLEVVAILKQAPEITQANLFELATTDFQTFALWLDIVERSGRGKYLQLRDRAEQLQNGVYDSVEAL